MLTSLALVLAASVLRTAALSPFTSDPLAPPVRTVLLPTVPPDELFTVIQPRSQTPSAAPPGVKYEHSISLGPNSNYYVYYSDSVQNPPPQQLQPQEQQQLQSPLVYQPLVGNSNEQSSQIVYNTNAVPVQLVTLVQPSLEAAIQQENATANGFQQQQQFVQQQQVEQQQQQTQQQQYELQQQPEQQQYEQQQRQYEQQQQQPEQQQQYDQQQLLEQQRPEPNFNEGGIQKLVTSTQDLVTNEDVVSINNAEEEKISANLPEQNLDKPKLDTISDSEPSASFRRDHKLKDNLAVASFDKPIVVGETAEGVSSRNQRSGGRGESSYRQINVEIIGEADDHNKGQFLKETTVFANKQSAEPCDDDQKIVPVEIKHEVTTIRPITVTAKVRGTTSSRLSTRFRTTTANVPSSTAHYTTVKEPVTITPKPIPKKFLAPIQAGLRLSNSEKNIEDCNDADQKTVVEVQKSINIKNILIDEEQPQPVFQREFGARTKLVPQPIFIEKPVDRIVKQNVYIEKPVDRLVPQPIYIEKPVTQLVDRIVEKKVPVPYPVEKIVEKPVQTTVHVPYPVEKQVPVHHYIDRPVPQHVPVPVTVEKIVEKPVTVEKIVTKEVQVPYPVTQYVEKIVDRPVPVEKIVTKEVQVPYPVTQIVDRPYPVEVPVEKIVEKIVDRPVEKLVEKHIEVPVPVTVEKVVEKLVDRPVPYPVQVPVEVPVQVPVHYPVEIPVGVPIPYAVEKLIAVPIHEPKPTHSIIKTVHHHKLFDFHKLFGGKKKHHVEHFILKAPPLPKPPVYEVPGKHLYFHSQFPKNDLHFGASIPVPAYVDVAQFNVLPNHFVEKPKAIYGVPLGPAPADPYNGNPYPQYSYQTNPFFHNHLTDQSHFVGKFSYAPVPAPPPTQIYKDDYVGPTPLLEDHWAVKSDVKFRRSPTYGKSLRIEYGGFKPPLVPSLEIDEHGVPLNKEQPNA